MTRPLLAVPCVVLSLLASPTSAQQTREQKVRGDREKITAEGFWIYGDLEKGFAEAKRTGKPILAVLRCLPCEECVKLDDDLVEQHPRVRPLLEKFVRVRIVSTNGLDLSLFQFDTDQSFAAFLFAPDRTIYGRFGTRSHRTSWADDVSIEGLAEALEGALALHAAYPANKAQLAGKTGPKPDVPAPEEYPLLKGKYGSHLNYDGNVVQSCIHCHQIGDAQRARLRSERKPFPQEVLFPHPHPKSQGLILDPTKRATVLRVEPDSSAARAGFRAGDEIVSLAGQPLLSIADVQWVLHRTPAEGGTLEVVLRNGGKERTVAWKLESGWRTRDDISWRVSSWGMRRMTTGGLVLERLPDEERGSLGLKPTDMALRVKHVGQFGPHTAAKNAGFQLQDVLVSFDGRSDLAREADLFAHALNARKAGEQVEVVVLRKGERRTLRLPMQP